MKLLIDQNLPPRLVPLLQGAFPGTVHVNAIGLGGAPDIALWRFAQSERFDIMTRDEDFAALAIRRVGDICVVWVRAGNLALRDLLQRIAFAMPSIHAALRTRSLRIIEIR
jgi:predicted nuclease of predicted toxin-antitoxin system